MAVSDTAPAVRVTPPGTLLGVVWAGLASTLYRIARGEGALLAVNLSVIACSGVEPSLALAQSVVSALAILSMYAFNDFYDAPADAKNPKKDPALVAAYLEHRRANGTSIAVLSVLTLLLARGTLGAGVATIVGTVFAVNLVYSTLLKGVPLADVLWCGVWGSVYVAIVDAAPVPVLVIGLMTAVCHLFQTLGDREPDAANGIFTTAVRSPKLATNVLFALSLSLFLLVRPYLGTFLGLTAFAPFGFYFVAEAHTGWLLSKAYFGVVWLYLLGAFHAAG